MKLTYDKTIKVGDIVTGYYKGYWRVTNVEQRNNYTMGSKTYHPAPLITAELVLDSNGMKAKRRTANWDISYSKKITKEVVQQIIDQEVAEFVQKKANLMAMIGE